MSLLLLVFSQCALLHTLCVCVCVCLPVSLPLGHAHTPLKILSSVNEL